MGKEEKAMFRAHSDACLPVSHVDQRLVDAMLSGELIDEPPLRKHVYCVLLKCKLISKDGKLQKYAVLGKMSAKPDAKNATKVKLQRIPTLSVYLFVVFYVHFLDNDICAVFLIIPISLKFPLYQLFMDH